MTKEKLPKGQTVNTDDLKEEDVQKPEIMSVEKVLGEYPIDREKCRDVILLQISNNLGRIANSLEAITQGLVAANTHLAQNNILKQKRHAGL